MNGINWKRILLGTLTGGAAWFVVGTVRAIGLGLLGSSGGGPRFAVQPGPDYTWAAIASCPFFACLAGWLYASIRPRYGPGPGTAVRAGVALGLAMWMTDTLWATAASTSLEYRIASVLSGFVLAVSVTLIVAWSYQEVEPQP